MFEIVDEETGTPIDHDLGCREHPDPGYCPCCQGDPIYIGRYGVLYIFECRDCKAEWFVVDRGDE